MSIFWLIMWLPIGVVSFSFLELLFPKVWRDLVGTPRRIVKFVCLVAGPFALVAGIIIWSLKFFIKK